MPCGVFQTIAEDVASLAIVTTKGNVHPAMLSPALRSWNPELQSLQIEVCRIPEIRTASPEGSRHQLQIAKQAARREACLPFAVPSLGGPVTFCHRLQPIHLAKGSQGRGGGGCCHGLQELGRGSHGSRLQLLCGRCYGICVMPQALDPDAFVAFWQLSHKLDMRPKPTFYKDPRPRETLSCPPAGRPRASSGDGDLALRRGM